MTFIIAFASRVFSVIRYESIIHEFDPWFNYRATRVLDEKGRNFFYYWFDTESWYPLGRFVGFTVFANAIVGFAVPFVVTVFDVPEPPFDDEYAAVFVIEKIVGCGRLMFTVNERVTGTFGATSPIVQVIVVPAGAPAHVTEHVPPLLTDTSVVPVGTVSVMIVVWLTASPVFENESVYTSG